jgi:hypothetical protein
MGTAQVLGPGQGEEAAGEEGGSQYLSLRCFFTFFFFLRRGEALPQLWAQGWALVSWLAQLGMTKED